MILNPSDIPGHGRRKSFDFLGEFKKHLHIRLKWKVDHALKAPCAKGGKKVSKLLVVVDRFAQCF